MSKLLWRIAADTPDYGADDGSGKGAELTGGRWNKKGTPAIYCSETTAMAVLETLVHFKAGDLPLNRYLVSVDVPNAQWKLATRWAPAILAAAWDALPAGRDSIDAGTAWLRGKENPLLLVVPSVIVPHESNVIVNPRHPEAASLIFRKIYKWNYDVHLLKR